MKTTVYKGLRGWAAKTEMPFDDKRELHFSTTKNFNGHLITTVSVVEVKAGFVVYKPFDDFHETLRAEKVRVSEKAVREQHQRGLVMLEQVKSRAVAHYASKAAG